MTDTCACPRPHDTADGRCVNEPLRYETPNAGVREHTQCACCMADCTDVHPEPDPEFFIGGTMTVAEEYVRSLKPEKQRALRVKARAGTIRIVPRAEMRLDTD